MKIGIFDSGIGGLTVLKELIENKPNNEYYYVGDTLNMPYGNKSHRELFECASKIIDYFISIDVELIIIACGTVSSTIYEELKRKYKDVTILDIISPTINYLNKLNYKNIAVVATKNTIESRVFEKRLKCENIYSLALPKLASIIENKEEYEEYLNNELEFFKNKKIDLLILGCTHYPIIEDYFNISYKTFNMAKPFIEEIDNGTKREIKIYFTSVDDTISDKVKSIVNIENIEKIIL